MTDASSVPLVTIGRIVRAHGIRGEVSVNVLTDLPDRFDVGRQVSVAGRDMVIATSRPHQGRMLLRFEGLHDRTSAELLRGASVEAEPRGHEDADHYFVHELVGLRVVFGQRDLGAVDALIELPAAAGYDLLEIRRDDGSTWLLPAVEDHVEIEPDDNGDDRLRVIDPPEGLIDGEPDVVRPPDPSDAPAGRSDDDPPPGDA